MSDLATKIRRLEEAGRKLAADPEPADLCQRVVDVVAEAFRMDICALFLVEDRGRTVLAAHYHYQVDDAFREIPVGKGLVGWVAEHGEPALVPDVRAEPRYLNAIDTARSEVTVPLRHEGKVIGVIDLESREPAAFDRDDLLLLSVFAGQAGAILGAARARAALEEEISRLTAKAARFELIHRVGQTLVDGPDLKTAMQRVAELVATSLGYNHTSVLLFDPALEELEIISAYGYCDTKGLRIPVSQGATGYAARHGEPVIISDVTSDPRYVKGLRNGRSELAVPVTRGGAVCGVIDVESPDLAAFGEKDVALLQVVASYTAAAVAAACCEESLAQERAAHARTELKVQLLGRVGEALNAIVEPDALFAEILRLAAEVLHYDRSAILLVEPETGHLVLSHSRGYPETERGSRVPANEGVTGRAYRLGQPVLVSSVEKDEGYIEVAPGAKSEMAIPLRAGNECIGILDVESVESVFTRADLGLLAAFGEQVSTALTSSRLRADAARQVRTLDERARRLDLLNRVARSLTRRLAIDDLIEVILRLCTEAFDIDHCAILLKDDTAPDTLVLRAAIGYDRDAPRRLPLGKGITGHVASSGVPALVPDVTQDPRYVTGMSGGRAEMAAPLRVFGDIIGVLDAESADVGAFGEEDLDLFASFAAQAAVAIHNANMAARSDGAGGR
ncbi:MAG: GAF domain-containing protein [Deltaproteobacteria bacterium]|nr:GAF domain-containing protein [Deltaproteobacteria bacterium]